MKITRICLTCNKIFLWDARPSRIKAGWGKFCSNSCKAKFNTPLIKPWLSNIGKPAHNKGKKQLSTTGINNPNWGGDNVGYGGLHTWVNKYSGKPNFCEGCGNENKKKYEWANISGKYKRDLNDWIRLCTSCHHIFDNIASKRQRNERGNFV